MKLSNYKLIPLLLLLAFVSCELRDDGNRVADITLEQTSATLFVGENLQLSVVLTPADVANPTITWSSSNISVATISNTGVVSAVADGTTIVTATTQDGGHTATSTVTVGTIMSPPPIPIIGCNNNTPGWGVDGLGTIGWGSVRNTNIETGTTTIIGTGGRPTQVWSSAVSALNCNKTTFNGGDWIDWDDPRNDFNADCRSNPGFPGDLFSWCAVVRFADQLCPYPWRVPTRQDFIDLDLNLGGTGENRWSTAQFVQDNYIIRWHGFFCGWSYWTGTLYYQNRAGRYWSQSEDGADHAFDLRFYMLGLVHPQHSDTKINGLSLRCVR